MKTPDMTEDEFLTWVSRTIVLSQSTADVLREFRRLLEMTQDEMARFLDVTLSSYTKWESAKVQPAAQNLLKLIRGTHDAFFIDGQTGESNRSKEEKE